MSLAHRGALATRTASLTRGCIQRGVRQASGRRASRLNTLRVQAMRVWCVSDLHTDYAENEAWVAALSDTEYKEDALILAGDVSDDVAVFRRTLACLASKWRFLFFTPGNHCLWLRRGSSSEFHDSLGKWARLRAICDDLGVYVTPKQVGGVWVCPILSWYQESWDTEPDVPGALAIDKAMVDYHACKWPDGLGNGSDALAARFDSLNEPVLSNLAEVLDAEEAEAGGGRPPLITFSHYLPLQALLPEKRMLFQPNLAKAVGSGHIAQRIAELRPLAHVFGHTHFQWDARIGGVRYVQWPLGSPRERRRRSGGEWMPMLLYDTATGLSPPRHCYWSAYYDSHTRDPTNVTPAQWVRTPHALDGGN